MVWVLGEVSHHGNKTDTQSEGDQEEGQEAVKDALRSEGRIWGNLLVTLGLELVGLSSLGAGFTFSWCRHSHC